MSKVESAQCSVGPMHDGAWWSRQPLTECGVLGVDLMDWLRAPLTAESVVVPTHALGEVAPDPYCYPVIFPTFADMVLWVRWCALPLEERMLEWRPKLDSRGNQIEILRGFCGADVTLTGPRKEFADILDEALSEVDAGRLMESIFKIFDERGEATPGAERGVQSWVVAECVLLTPMTIHEFFNDLVEQAELAGEFGDEVPDVRQQLGLTREGVVCEGGVWSMPPEAWARALKGFDHVSVYPSI